MIILFFYLVAVLKPMHKLFLFAYWLNFLVALILLMLSCLFFLRFFRSLPFFTSLLTSTRPTRISSVFSDLTSASGRKRTCSCSSPFQSAQSAKCDSSRVFCRLLCCGFCDLIKYGGSYLIFVFSFVHTWIVTYFLEQSSIIFIGR